VFSADFVGSSNAEEGETKLSAAISSINQLAQDGSFNTKQALVLL
jgi:hypothetical protein